MIVVVPALHAGGVLRRQVRYNKVLKMVTVVFVTVVIVTVVIVTVVIVTVEIPL
jgi:hypothetical protein